jgi:hypothetical protein
MPQAIKYYTSLDCEPLCRRYFGLQLRSISAPESFIDNNNAIPCEEIFGQFFFTGATRHHPLELKFSWNVVEVSELSWLVVIQREVLLPIVFVFIFNISPE